MEKELQETKVARQKFLDTDFYKSVKKRKKKLVRRLLENDPKNWASILPLTKVYIEEDFDDLALFLNVVKVIEKTEFQIDKYFPHVTMLSGSKMVECNFICVEYFHLYTVTADRTEMRRYSYFECYYDKYVLSCIMDISEVTRVSVFQPLDMDKNDWGHARQQIKLWNRVLQPEVMELPVAEYKFSKETCTRMRAYSNMAQELKQTVYESSDMFPDVNDPQWIVLSYLLKLQFLSLLPKSSVPKYYINLVCKDKTDRDKLARDLQNFLGSYFKTDPVIKGDVQRLTQLLNKLTDMGNDAAKPYVFVPEKPKDMEQLQAIMNTYVAEGQGRKSHPFKTFVPICVSEKQILDSTVLNVTIKDASEIKWDSTKYERLKYSISAMYDLCRHFGKKKIRYLLEYAIKIVKESAKAAYCKNSISETAWKQIVEYESDLYELALFFAVLRQRSILKINIHETLILWLTDLTQELCKKQSELDTVIEGLMIEFRKQYEGLRDERPVHTGRKTEQEMMFRTMVNDDHLLCYDKDYFKVLLKEAAPNVDSERVLKRMGERGIFRTKDDKTLLYGIRLNCADGTREKNLVNHYAIKMK